jgi:aspartyl-tRNA(Asn)/glutamyl-tRNA(Gln) amidotransferase subunit A
MHKTVAQISQDLFDKKYSATELALDYLNKMSLDNTQSYCFVNKEKTLQEAKKADELLSHQTQPSLVGVPIAHKDLFCIEGWDSRAGSKILEGFVSPYDATVVSQLKKAGMVTLGKVSMDEFAMGSFTSTSPYGKVKHPLDHTRTAGGSSGGSASAVLAGLAPITSGSDTGGSVRLPASFCGLYGIKPTYGAISRYGMIAYASSLDQAGFIGSSALDLSLILKEVAIRDEKDSTCYGLESLNHELNLFKKSLPLEGKKVALVKEFMQQGLQEEIALAIEAEVKHMTELGAKVEYVSLESIALAVSAYYIIASAEATSNLSRYDGIRYGIQSENYEDLFDYYCQTRSLGFGDEVKRRILIGTHVLCSEFFDAYYVKAQKARRVILEEILSVLKEFDFILAPTFATTAPKFDVIDKQTPEQVYLSDAYTIPFSLAGVPGVAYPVGFDKNQMPIGLQLIGSHFSDYQLLDVVYLLEKTRK